MLTESFSLSLSLHAGYPEAKVTDLIKRYNAFIEKILQLDLHSAVDAKPLLDVSILYYSGAILVLLMGNIIISRLHVPPPSS
jgi:hypothetical protein